MIKLAIVGVGKIVRDQHLPSVKETDLFKLVATASRNGFVESVPAYPDIETMLSAHKDVEAVALCMPPQYRFEAACAAIDHGCHVLLEKPPGATISEVQHLTERALARGVSLYATWHSRHAPAVEYCRSLLATTNIRSAHLRWREDVRKWHPDQAWIWQAGGLGVFDPGINGLSILSAVVPDHLRVSRAELQIPANKQTPIAAHLNLTAATGYNVRVELDWRVQKGEESEIWQIKFATDQGTITLSEGGAVCLHNGSIVYNQPDASPWIEYIAIYREFAQLIESASSSVDLVPMQLVADSFMLAEVLHVEEFD